MFRFLEAARRRVAAVRSGDGAGFIMIYVLMITTIVTVVVSGTLVVSTNSIVPSVQASYDQAADAAAQGGLQAFIAYADQNCTNGNSSVTSCTLPSNYSNVTAIPIPNAAANYSATYSWVAAKDPSGRYFRVKSTGTVQQGGVSATKVVVGDVVGGASLNLLDYGVVTGFEGQSSSDVLTQWPARTIALDAGAANAADYPIKGGAIRWSGTSPGTAAGKAAVCNATFDAKGGRSTNLPSKAPNPYVDVTESGLAGNNYTHFIPCQTTWGTQSQLLAPDNPANGAGGYYSNDALLLSNSYPGGSGPLFNQPVTTNWRYTSADAGICSTAPGQNYRSFDLLCAGYPLEVGGSPATSSLYRNVQWVQGPQLPTSVPTIPASACRYAGPTRIVLQGSTAVVTSPQTTPSWVAANAASQPPQCYTGAGAQGMSAQTVSLTTPTTITTMTADNNGAVPNTTPAIAHGSSGWPTTGQKLGTTASTSNSVFYASASPASSADPASATAANSCTATATYSGATKSTQCQWSDASSDTPGVGWSSDGPGWVKFTGTACPTTDPTDRTTFACEYGGGNPASVGTQYPAYRNALVTALSSASVAVAASAGAVAQGTTCTAQAVVPATATGSQLACLAQDLLHQANTSGNEPGWASPAVGSHQYVATAGATTTAAPQVVNVGSAPTAPNAGDPFFSTTTGTASTETLTARSTPISVARQVYGCYVPTTVLQTALNTLGLSSLAPGAYDPTNQACTVSGAPGVYSWGDGGISAVSINASVPQFQFVVTQNAYSQFQLGTAAISRFPSMRDVTQYQMGNAGTFGASGPGDIYVEGNADHTMALVAADDLVVTGSTKPTDPTTAAIEMLGRQDVRVYHPVQCRITDATMITNTDPGFCPDDITGLYYTTPTTAYRPDQQYVNMRPDLSESNGFTIQGAIFALGNAAAHITCPQPPNGGGVCGGEFTVDNYNRGNGLGHLNIVGTLGMAHHGPVGQEWEIDDASGQTSRPYSGYQLAEKYLNMKALIAGSADVTGILKTTSATSSLWHIMSISTGSAS